MGLWVGPGYTGEAPLLPNLGVPRVLEGIEPNILDPIPTYG